jgi:hypothetical protein
MFYRGTRRGTAASFVAFPVSSSTQPTSENHLKKDEMKSESFFDHQQRCNDYFVNF